MPYIKKQDRQKYDPLIEEIFQELACSWGGTDKFPAGDLNYIFSSIVKKLFDCKKQYLTANDIMGVLNGVNLEFYRRWVSGYEDKKILSNGDI